MLDLSLRQSETITIDSTIYFRITDACNYRGDTVMAINHHYHGDIGEIEYYVGTTEVELRAASKRLWGFNPNEESFTFLVKIYPSDKGGLSWITAKTFQPGTDNWEGIIDFDEGFLIVTDALPDDAGIPKSRIRYVTLNR